MKADKHLLREKTAVSARAKKKLAPAATTVSAIAKIGAASMRRVCRQTAPGSGPARRQIQRNAVHHDMSVYEQPNARSIIPVADRPQREKRTHGLLESHGR